MKIQHFLALVVLSLATVPGARAAVLAGPITNAANAHAYYLLSSNTWTASEAEAVGLGGHLITINDAAENQWVLNTFFPLTGAFYGSLWIGLNDAANEGQFVWASGEPVTFTYWYPGEPNNLGLGGEDYATIRHPSEAPPTGSWNDLANTPSAPTFGVVEVPTPLPVAVTQPADQFMPGSARLNGQANPNGSPTLAWFEWGTSLAYGNVTPPQSVGSGSNAVGLSNVIVGLVSGTDYHFRARASNTFGSLAGLDQTFNLSNQLPVVTTLAADQLTTNSARLRGQVNPHGSPTAAWFEWGTDTNYGNVIGMQDVGQGSSASNLNVVLNGLTTGTNYYYRLVATNAFGAVYGANQTFNPAQRPPTTITWTGTDPSGYWAAPANWSPAGVLVNGDDLVFPGGLPPGDMVSTNDLTDSIFRSITFSGASRHTIRGNPITLTNSSGVISSSGTNVIVCDLILSAIPSPSTPYYQWPRINILYPGELTLSGNIGGSYLNVAGGRFVLRGQFPGGRMYAYGGTQAFYGDFPHALSVTNVGGTLLVQGSQPNLSLTTLWEMESAACASLSAGGVVGDIAGCGHITVDTNLSVNNLGHYGGWGGLDIRLNGTNVGQYGRVVVSGDVSLNYGSLGASGGFNPQGGQVFTIVEKTSPGAITNAPFGPEGTITTLNGKSVRISYVGGNGNDLTLTVEESNTPPIVTITNPPAGAVFTAPASFSLEASASDPDGSVTNVQFFRDATSLGSDTNSPYSVSVSGLVAGDYTLSAVASDNRGLRATNSIAISVNNNSNCVAVSSGLVAWWRAEGNANDAANDATGAHDGQLLFGAAFAPGRTGQAFSFDGVRSRVSIPDSDAFKLTDSLTCEGWIQAASWAPGFIFFRGDNRGGLDPYLMTLSSSGHLRWQIDAADNSFAAVDDPNTLPIGVWTHVAGVLNGANGDLDLYVNGSLVSHTTTGLRPLRDLDPNSGPAVGIGNHGGTVHNFPYHGLIDEWSLYGRALSGQEILGIYQAGALGKCTINQRPVVTTLAADQLSSTSARLRGQVNPRGWPTTAWFEWGTDTNYGNLIGMQDAGQGSSVSNLNVVLNGLIGGPTYHYRMVATNAFGAAYGADQTFYLGFVSIPIPGLPGVSFGSVAWGDYDNDGRLDLLLTGSGISQVWRNTGSGFSNVTASVAPGLPGVDYSSVAWGDYNNDGRLDFLLTGAGAGSQVWRNTGSAFSNVTASVAPGLPAVSGSSVAWGDYDNDGRLDFLLTGSGISQVWRNTGSAFSNVTASVAPGLPGVSFGSVAWGDYDNDGRLDFLLTGSGISQVWRNTGSGFSNVTASVAPGLAGVYLGSAAWGDYDNDGRLDFLLTSTYYGSQLWRNTGSGFSNVTASVAPGLPARSSVAWGDYDNDGRLDFLIAGTSNAVPPQLWRNTGGGFSNVTASVAPGLPGVYFGSVVWGDYDNDGRLDFLHTAAGQLWQNNMPVSNAPPAAPTGLSSTLSGATVSLSWNPPADDRTPSAGLNYNLRIGTTPGASDVLAPMALTDGLRLLPALGNAQAGTNAVMNLPFGRYYWSVQAVDTSFAGSPFAVEQLFTIAPRIFGPLWLGNGHFQFSFTNQSSAVFEILGTTNVALPPAQWTVLGPPVSLGGGLYQFTDILATNHAQRFYLLRQQ